MASKGARRPQAAETIIVLDKRGKKEKGRTRSGSVEGPKKHAQG